MLNKRILVLIFLLVFLPLAGCFPSPAPPNQAPVITSSPITAVTVGETYVYNVKATDPDGDTLTYSLTVKPTGMTIVPATGLIKWTPTAKGNYAVVVKVSDGALDITQSFTIVVSEPSAPPQVNHAPIITSIPNLATVVGIQYTYTIEATDPDGDILTYSLTTNPSGMAIDPGTGVISWIPTAVGEEDVTVKASDGKLSDTQSFTIAVGTVEISGIVVLPETMTLIVGGEPEAIKSVTATYIVKGFEAPIPLGDCTYTSDPTGIVIVNNNFEVEAIGVGITTITVNYAGMEDTIEVTVVLPVHNIDTGEYFDTIQGAIVDEDTKDDHTIEVAAGTYNLIAPIAVTKSVTITGDIDTPSNVVVDAGTAGADRDGFQIRASHVTIQGFKIQGALDTEEGQNNGITIGNWWVGTSIPGLEYIVISYNEITNCSKGISVYRAQHVEISHNEIHDCPTSTDKSGSWPGKGIMLYGEGSGVQNNDIDILNNWIYNNGLFGIELNHWDASTSTGDWVDVDVLIDDNIIYNNGMSWNDVGYPIDCGRGISANGHETGVTITNNEVYGHWSTSGGRFAGSAAGIRVNDSKGFVISDNNNVHDNMRGIYIYGTDTTFGGENTGFVVTGNDVHDNAQGIVFGDGDVGSAHLNNIHDNDVTTYIADGVSPSGAVTLGEGTFDATNNWWGSEYGPKHNGFPAEGGDAVSDNVDYSNWSLIPY